MITDPLHRTKTLYAWEREVIHSREDNHGIEEVTARYLVMRYWGHYGLVDKQQMPALIKAPRECPAAWNDLIWITPDNDLISTTLHELAHVHRRSKWNNPHNKCFVEQYIDALAWWFAWDWEELYIDARLHGLL